MVALEFFIHLYVSVLLLRPCISTTFSPMYLTVLFVSKVLNVCVFFAVRLSDGYAKSPSSDDGGGINTDTETHTHSHTFIIQYNVI